MKHNRMIHALLAAAVAAGLVLPASAAGTSSFSDVKDPATSVNADILRLMGVADGTGDNRFNPSQKLTRAQFCTMVVNFMGMGDDVVLHSTRTIFTDVPSSHWARGYVNLAASTMLEDGGSSSGTGSDSDPKPAGTPLISGIGDGRFLPAHLRPGSHHPDSSAGLLQQQGRGGLAGRLSESGPVHRPD